MLYRAYNISIKNKYFTKTKNQIVFYDRKKKKFIQKVV